MKFMKTTSNMKLMKTNMESQKTLFKDFDDNSYDARDDHESALDGESAPVHHVPKINEEIPSLREAASGDGRLLNRLQSYGLKELKVMGDGNCQFRSLSDQIYGSPDQHELVREQVVKQLKSRADFYENFATMAYGEYLSKMSRNGEWGDHLTLQAASDWFGVRIFVITTFKDTCYIEILPQAQKPDKTIFLSYRDQVHYNSVYPIRERDQVHYNSVYPIRERDQVHYNPVYPIMELRLSFKLKNKRRWCWLR